MSNGPAGPPWYLLRLDDLCDTCDPVRLTRLAGGICAEGVRPIAAIVPDNRDPALRIAPPDSDFWRMALEWQSLGWSVGLHGLHHRYTHTSRFAGPDTVARGGEFSGESPEVVRSRIREGIRLLGERGLAPTVFVAPGHALDDTTVDAVESNGIRVVSEGFSLFPYCRKGVLWIPQQGWRPRAMPLGVWTFCVHPNEMDEEKTVRLLRFLRVHRDRFTDVPEMERRYGNRRRSLLDAAFEKAYRLAGRAWFSDKGSVDG
jgi:peptidoglycan/xylan/chitin deacetylase (PgdA/CDA1 family)